jgi:hypothetical protein
VVRHPVRLLVQLPVAELAFPEYDGNGFGIAVDLKLEQLMRTDPREIRVRVVPLEQLRPVVFRQRPPEVGAVFL